MNKLPFSEPHASGVERAAEAKATRDLATEIARLRPRALTSANGEETDHGPQYPANFTKGLKHDADGLVENAEDYRGFVEAINSPDRNLFERSVTCALDRVARAKPPVDDPETPAHETRSPSDRELAAHLFVCRTGPGSGRAPTWRGWESPRSGHAFDLQGPDAAAVGMAPAPRVGSSELAAEMSEVYALAILRDVPFEQIEAGGGDQLIGTNVVLGGAALSSADVALLLGSTPFYSGVGRTSSTPAHADSSGLNRFERNRRIARTGGLIGGPTTDAMFRGSTAGAQEGPTISQFMLIGSPSHAGGDGGTSTYPDRQARFDVIDGYLRYGSQIVDQRVLVHKNGLDYMTNWSSWLDVQNGARLNGGDSWEPTRRFITTPRDLATYVHVDALYQAYLNAALIMMGLGVPFAKGFPEPSPRGKRDAFVTFGGPHILSLVTEVATRGLKAVRRQKFNHHRRARPETIAARLALVAGGRMSRLGAAAGAFQRTHDETPEPLRSAVRAHNDAQNTEAMREMRVWRCEAEDPSWLSGANLLLPMAFPEGSPMHPAYGAGHATVAGACVTVLKAFFDMFETGDSGRKRRLVTPEGEPIVYRPDQIGERLVSAGNRPLTVQGELDKLAANISIGRNMAGVHYYSDYYDSARMGERVAVGMLMEQAPTYGDGILMRFHSFDGDLIEIRGEGGASPSLAIIDASGAPVTREAWWLRHVVGGEEVADL